MNLVFIGNDFSVDPAEVSSLEAYEHWKHDPGPSGNSFLDHSGTIVIQKCGRKTYLKGFTVKQIHAIIQPAPLQSEHKRE